MGIDFSQFKDLTPERRARELQKLIENLKNEIEDRQKDLKEAEKRLAEAYEEARIIEHVSIPETRKIPEKEKKATVEEKVAVAEEKPKPQARSKAEQAELEKLLATAPPRSDQLFHKFSQIRVEELYGALRGIYDREKSTGIEREKDRELVYAIRKGIEIKKEEGYTPAKKDRHLMTAAEQMADSMYNSAGSAYKGNPN